MTEHEKFIKVTLKRCCDIKAAVDGMEAGPEKEKLTTTLKIALNLFIFILKGKADARRI